MNNSLPKNGKEGFIYGSIICFFTCLFMATINISINFGGVSKESMLIVAKGLPLVFIIAMVLEGAVIGKVAEKLVEVFTAPTDSFNAYVLFRTLFTVIGMSVCMTFVGGILANGFSAEVFEEFIVAWPRNACLALFFELVMIQPFARKVMRSMHAAQDAQVAQ